MMLVAPSCSIRIWASRLAPSPTASIEITAATPKIEAQGRQARAELVQHQALQPELQPAPDASHHERLIGRWGFAGGRAGAAGRPADHRPEAARSPIRRIRATADGNARPVPDRLYRGVDAPVNRSSRRATRRGREMARGGSIG